MLRLLQCGGFYVEIGAFDGERASNTVYLERERGWTGLLVEMDPYFYTQLIGKSRRSWSINACLSPHPYVTQVQPLNCQVTTLSKLFTHVPLSDTKQRICLGLYTFRQRLKTDHSTKSFPADISWTLTNLSLVNLAEFLLLRPAPL